MDKRQIGDPRQKGDIAETLFKLECLKRNIEIFEPINSGSRIDFLIRDSFLTNDSNPFKRVQIKYISSRDGKIVISFVKGQNGRNLTLKYNSNEIDYFFVYCPCNNNWYNIPIKDVDAKRGLTLRVNPAKNNQSKGVYLASDYIW